MKKQLIFIFLLTIVCIAPVFSQEKTSESEKLTTKFIKLNNLELKVIDHKCIATFDENGEKFIRFIKKSLSLKGEVEVDSRSNTLIITDSESRVKIIANFVKLLDASGFTLKEIVK